MTLNLSGILVVTRPRDLASAVATLNALGGVEVHYCNEVDGRIVVVQEAEDVEQEIAGLKRIQALPEVLRAELVYHRFDQDNESSGNDASPSVPISLQD